MRFESGSCSYNRSHQRKKGLRLEVLGRGRRSTLWTRRQGAPGLEVTEELGSTTIKVGARGWRHWEQWQAAAGHGRRRWRRSRGRAKQRRRWRTRAAVQSGSGARRIKDAAGSSWRLATKRGGGTPGSGASQGRGRRSRSPAGGLVVQGRSSRAAPVLESSMTATWSCSSGRCSSVRGGSRARQRGSSGA